MSEQGSLDGLLVIDKPTGWTSHDVVARIRRLTRSRRAGHAGTLDPLATGVLVLGIGQGTRVLRYLSDSNKTYQAIVRLGQTTNTYDAAGERIGESPINEISQTNVQAALHPFRGSFNQLPPVYSAIKVAGRPLYRYARAGIDVELSPRPVHVYRLELLEFEPPLLRLEIESAAGFYVRSLAHDLGQSLGCGAHLAELRRTRAGPFNESDAISMSAVEDAVAADCLAERLRSLDVPLLDQPAVILAEQHSRDVTQGKPLPLAISGAPRSERLCRAYSSFGELIGVLELDSDGTARPVRVFPEGHRGPNIESE